jgi:hypothetical protein
MGLERIFYKRYGIGLQTPTSRKISFGSKDILELALKLGARSAYMLGMNPMAVKAVANLGVCCLKEIFLPFEEDVGCTPEIGDFVFK